MYQMTQLLTPLLKQVHRNNNYFYMKTTIFLDKMNKKIHQNTLIVTSF